MGKLERTRSTISRWQGQKFQSSQANIIACEEEVGSLLNSQLSSNEKDLITFMSKRSELMAKLAHLRTIEKSYSHQKFKIRWVKESD